MFSSGPVLVVKICHSTVWLVGVPTLDDTVDNGHGGLVDVLTQHMGATNVGHTLRCLPHCAHTGCVDPYFW